MRRLAATLFAAAAAACGRGLPETAPGPPGAGGPITAAFEARLRGPGAAGRIRGVLAMGSGGRVRIEVAGPAGLAPILIVADPASLSAYLPAERLFYQGPADASFLEAVARVPVSLEALAAILGGEAPEPPGGCALHAARGRAGPAGGRIPTRILLECGGASVRLRLRDVRPLAVPAGADPFAAPGPPPGFRRGGLEEVAAALRGEAGPPG